MTAASDKNSDNQENVEANATENAEVNATENVEVNATENAEQVEKQPTEEPTQEVTEEKEEKPADTVEKNDNVATEKPAKPEEHETMKKSEPQQAHVAKETNADKTEGHLLMPNDSKIKFVQDSFGFSNEKTFEAPKFHPYLLMKNYSVQYMDPIIKKAKPRRFLCCS